MKNKILTIIDWNYIFLMTMSGFMWGIVYENFKHDLELPLAVRFTLFCSLLLPHSLACHILRTAWLKGRTYFIDNFNEN